MWRLGLALVLSTAVGIEREIRQKDAGLRTYALVGLGAALFTLISTYGFADVLSRRVVLDPSRVAAQIVTGIGFIGGGVIFVQRASVRGLTTAAGIWSTAAIGMAAGGNLPVLAAAGTVGYLLISVGYPFVSLLLPAARGISSTLEVTYLDGAGVLRSLVAECAAHRFAIADLKVEHEQVEHEQHELRATGQGEQRNVTVRLDLRGRGAVAELIGDLDALDGVLSVHARDRIAADAG